MKMTKSTASSTTTGGWRLRIARLVISIWAFFWTYFLGANLLDNQNTVPASEQTKGYLVMASALLFIWGLTILVWRRPKLGGIIAGAVGLFMAGAYLISPPSAMAYGTVVSTALMLGGAPFVAGVLLWLSQSR